MTLRRPFLITHYSFLIFKIMRRIILIGYMGSGKTTIGKALSKDTGMMFYDLDWYIENRMRKSVSQLFAERGEEGFRLLEHNMLHEVAEFEDVIISCGGGTPCFFDNMDYLNQQGDVVYLKASPEVLYRHLLMAKVERPLLKGKSPDELIDYMSENDGDFEYLYWYRMHMEGRMDYPRPDDKDMLGLSDEEKHDIQQELIEMSEIKDPEMGGKTILTFVDYMEWETDLIAQTRAMIGDVKYYKIVYTLKGLGGFTTLANEFDLARVCSLINEAEGGKICLIEETNDDEDINVVDVAGTIDIILGSKSSSEPEGTDPD